MKKIASMVTSLLILMGTPALAGTSAQVEYGTVQESRILTQEATSQQGGDGEPDHREAHERGLGDDVAQREIPPGDPDAAGYRGQEKEDGPQRAAHTERLFQRGQGGQASRKSPVTTAHQLSVLEEVGSAQK